VGERKGGKPICSIHPNPANPQATLSFEITMPGRVTVRLFDINGRIVRNVAIGEYYEAGPHSLSVDGRGERGGVLASGVYFYRFEGPDGDATGRLIIAR
jgi:flagellar hook assembly protein FlgD